MSEKTPRTYSYTTHEEEFKLHHGGGPKVCEHQREGGCFDCLHARGVAFWHRVEEREAGWRYALECRQARIRELKAANARLQERVEEAERKVAWFLRGYAGIGAQYKEMKAERDRYKALAERQKKALEPERLAQAFHEAYEELAPQFGYKTREASAVPWADVPENNKRLMIVTCERVARAAIEEGT